MSLVLDEHRHYLADAARLDAFERAIAATVRPGDVVLDLASGTGILGLLACRYGAARVYAIELGAIAAVARQFGAANGFGDRIVFVDELSTRAVLPERVDVVVTDQAGRFGVDAGLLEYADDARRRFLKPGGRMVPQSLSLWAAPIETGELWDQLRFWAKPAAGFDVSAASAIAASTGYPRRFGPQELLGPGSCLGTIDLLRPAPALMTGSLDVTATRAGTLHGVAGWFTATLAADVTLTNAPGAPLRINRRNVFFPAGSPVRIDAGDRVRATFHIRPAETIVAWTIEVESSTSGGVVHRYSTSTVNGMLIDPAEMARQQPSFVPRLTPAGVARRTILELCDGAHELRDIERQVYERHRDLFAAPGDAAGFVAEVVSRYAR